MTKQLLPPSYPSPCKGEGMMHHFFVKENTSFLEAERRPSRALSEAEQAVVAGNRAAVHAHLPELVPFIKELHEAGMIDGWRGVSEVKLLKKEGKEYGIT